MADPISFKYLDISLKDYFQEISLLKIFALKSEEKELII